MVFDCIYSLCWLLPFRKQFRKYYQFPDLDQEFHYTCCITPKRVTTLRGPSPRHCARATQLLSKK